MKSQKDKATDFRNLHLSGRILVLPNAWDVPSARVFENTGFPAVATSSGGISASLGYQDGEKISRAEMLVVVRKIASSLSVPLSADMEAGFADSIEQIEETTKWVISSGAVGLNIEDASKKSKENPLFGIENQIAKIRAIKRVSDSVGIPLVINARTDVFRFLTEDKRLDECIARGNAYHSAGADCVFPFGVRDAAAIKKLVEKIDCPVNIRAGLGTPSIPELESLGVARVSLATGPICSVLGHLKRVALEIRQKGTYDYLTRDAITYDELSKLAVPI